MRRVWLAAVVVAASCGGSPMAPSAGAPPAGSLESGAYLLTVTMSTSGRSGFSMCVSLTIDDSPVLAGVAAPTPVRVDRAGNSVTITPEDPSATFRMQLQIAGGNLSGTASGQYLTSATPIAVAGSSAGTPATLTGLLGQGSASGGLEGSVSVTGMTCSNDGHEWRLTAR